MRGVTKPTLHILQTVWLYACIWIGQEVTAQYNNDVIHQPTSDHHYHVLTDGVDEVTWTMSFPVDKKLPPTKTGIGGGGGGGVDFTLTCNISRAVSENIPELSDKDTVDFHKHVCDLHSRRKRNIILPGTKWCGDGNIARDRNDLGTFQNLDKCCRHHDECPVAIVSGAKKYGLVNDSPFTLSSCVCDDVFKKCLNSVRSAVSNLIGSIYFNILPSRCIDLNLNSIRTNRGDTASLTRRGDSRPFIRDNPKFKISLPRISFDDILSAVQQLPLG